MTRKYIQNIESFLTARLNETELWSIPADCENNSIVVAFMFAQKHTGCYQALLHFVYVHDDFTINIKCRTVEPNACHKDTMKFYGTIKSTDKCDVNFDVNFPFNVVRSNREEIFDIMDYQYSTFSDPVIEKPEIHLKYTRDDVRALNKYILSHPMIVEAHEEAA